MGLFGPPKITLTLEKFSFNPGEHAKGTVTINLKKPTYARKLQVSLIGTRKVRKGNSTSWQKVYDFDIPVSGEKDYMQETVNFELPIPPDILSAKTQQQAMQNALEDKLGGAGSFISAVTVGAGQTKWKLRAQLDIPKSLDVKADQDIIISE
jgi:hypothetical protein